MGPTSDGYGSGADSMNASSEISDRPTGVTAHLFSRAKPFSHWIMLGLVVLLCLLEIGAYRTHGALPVIASRVWALMGVGYFAATAVLIVSSLIRDLRTGRYLFALLLIAVGMLVFYKLGNFHHLQINYESSKQVASFRTFNIHRPDWGYPGHAFVGYPARQFIIVAIPSLLFGNKVFWLQFGYATLFYSGVLCFYLGVRRHFAGKGHHELWALLTVLTCFTFPYLMHYLYEMEQILLPISLVMHALGWFLLSQDELTPTRVVILAWIAGLLGTSYTPSLAAWGLFLTLFVLAGVRAVREKRRPQLVLWSAVFTYAVTFGLCSFLTRIDVRLGSNPGHSTESLSKALKVFFLGSPQEYMPAVLAILVAVFLVLALTGRLGLIKLIIAIWSLVVIYFSATSSGYAPYDPVFTLYRSILLIPIMMLAVSDSYLGLFKKFATWKRIEPILAIILCLGAAAATVQVYVKREKGYAPLSKDFLITFLLNKAKSGALRDHPAVFVSMTSHVTYHPIQGYGEYFFPLWKMVIRPVDSQNAVQPKKSEPVVVLTDANIDPQTLVPAKWVGTSETAFLDAKGQRFPVRYGVYRYSP
jgi:hypothetical protein